MVNVIQLVVDVCLLLALLVLIGAYFAPKALSALWWRIRSMGRGGLLEPNRHSKIKVERYTFSVSKEIVLGSPCTFEMANWPDVNLRPQNLVMNAPCAGMFIIEDLRVANVSCMIGGPADAQAYSVPGIKVDLPTMSPANRMTARVRYTGLVPPPFNDWKGRPHTVASLMETIKKALARLDDQNTPEARGELQGAVDNAPHFTFCVTASGPATLVA